MFLNVVIGKPLVSPSELLAKDEQDWKLVEKEQTLFTNERNLPRIMKIVGMVSSTNEVKRNKPELCKNLETLDFLEIKWGKKRLFIVVGE